MTIGADGKFVLYVLLETDTEGKDHIIDFAESRAQARNLVKGEAGACERKLRIRRAKGTLFSS